MGMPCRKICSTFPKWLFKIYSPSLVHTKCLVCEKPCEWCMTEFQYLFSTREFLKGSYESMRKVVE